RRLRQPSPVRHRNDRAEIARERTPERRTMRDGPASQIVCVYVVVHGDAVIRQLGKLIGRNGSAQLVVNNARAILPGKAADPGIRTALSQDIDEVEERQLALRSDHEIDVRSLQNRSGVLGRKVAAPDNRYVGKLRTDLRASWHSLRKLGTRHDR